MSGVAGVVFGIGLSLVANICSAPALSVLQVTVAACPPLVLLLAVEPLNGALKHRSRETGSETVSAQSETYGRARETEAHNETVTPIQPGVVSRPSTKGFGQAGERLRTLCRNRCSNDGREDTRLLGSVSVTLTCHWARTTSGGSA